MNKHQFNKINLSLQIGSKIVLGQLKNIILNSSVVKQIKPCFLGAHCVNNECVPIYSIDKCAAVLCPADSTCKDGICIPIPVKVCTKFCIKGTRCVNN